MWGWILVVWGWGGREKLFENLCEDGMFLINHLELTTILHLKRIKKFN